MDHMEVWALESTAPSHWDKWIDAVERIVGHDLDGTFHEDGYSLDGCWEMYRWGLTPQEAADKVEADKAARQEMVQNGRTAYWLHAD